MPTTLKQSQNHLQPSFLKKAILPSLQHRAWMGAGWKIIAFACYAVLNAIARYLSGGSLPDRILPMPVSMIVFFQDLGALLILLPWVLRQVGLRKRPQHIRLHFLRILASASAIITWYFALAYLPLAEAVALSVIGPVFGVIGAKLFLREDINKFRLSCISFTFVLAGVTLGTYTIFLKNSGNILGLVFVLSSALLFALAKINTRQLALKGETAKTLTAYLLLFIVPMTFVPAFITWQTPTIAHLPWLALAGLLTAMAIYSVSTALSYAEVTFLAPFDFIHFILNIFVGYVAFTEIPAWWVVALVFLLMFFSGGSFMQRKYRLAKGF
ncbi:MAG TPA: DMT family transporter [Gammaproteobacteria bacterium]|nr:DMT family transporter [Gammaproteobacteria bacterium]